MDIVKNYEGKELTIQIKGRIDTVTAPDFENEIKSAKDENIILLDKAKEAMENAYAPYSGFKVGAALLCENGDIFCGYRRVKNNSGNRSSNPCST